MGYSPWGRKESDMTDWGTSLSSSSLILSSFTSMMILSPSTEILVQLLYFSVLQFSFGSLCLLFLARAFYFFPHLFQVCSLLLIETFKKSHLL